MNGMGTEKAGILNAFSISVFINKVFQGSGRKGKRKTTSKKSGVDSGIG